jgi:hypothetical protein
MIDPSPRANVPDAGLPPPDQPRGTVARVLLIVGAILVVATVVLIAAIRGTQSPGGTGQPAAVAPGSASPSGTTADSPTPRPGSPTPRLSSVARPSSSDGVPAGWPTAATTGVPGGTALTRVDGDLTVDTPGTVVQGKDIRGCVNVRADNVTIRASKITCPGAYGIRGFNDGTDFKNLRIEDTELDGQNQGFTAIAYSNFTALRLNIHGFENGFALGDDVTITDSYVHDLKLGDGLHPDDIQTNEGGTGYTIRHNSLLAPVTNSAIALCCTDGQMVSDVFIDDNYLAGGGWTLYCPRKAATGNRVTNNRFGPAHFGPASSCGPPGVSEFTGNTFTADGKPVPAG